MGTKTSLALARCGALLAVLAPLATAGCQEQAPVAAALVSGERGVSSIAVDDGFVYWTTASGAAKKASLDTGEVTTLSSTPGLAGNVTLDDTHVYFSVDASLFKVEKVSGALQSFPQKATINRISLDDENIYWSDVDDQNNINKMSKLGAAPTSLASTENALAVLAGSTNLLFGAESAPASPLTGEVATGGGLVNAVPVSGGLVSAFLSTSSNVLAMIQDTSRIFVAGAGADGGITVAALDGSNPQALASESLAVSLSSDNTNLYWSNATGQVQVVPVVGGTVTPLVSGPPGSVSMTLDPTNIYWANSSDEGIFAMPKQQAAPISE